MRQTYVPPQVGNALTISAMLVPARQVDGNKRSSVMRKLSHARVAFRTKRKAHASANDPTPGHRSRSSHQKWSIERRCHTRAKSHDAKRETDLYGAIKQQRAVRF